jgi:Zn-dependent protease with chaperone function
MANTHARTADYGGASLYLLRWLRSACVVLFGALATAEAGHAQTLTVHPRDLLDGEPDAFAALLEVSRPAPVSAEDMGKILKALPSQGEVTDLGFLAQQKVNAVRELLAATRRGWYEIKVVDLPQAVIALHARAVVLISVPAVTLLKAAELQALAAHEIGHEYVWAEWTRAHQHVDHERLKELELVCDAIAAVTLRQLGMDPSSTIDGIAKVTRFNRERFGAATNEKSYPTLAERRAFAHQLQRWLRDWNSGARSLQGGNWVTLTTQTASAAAEERKQPGLPPNVEVALEFRDLLKAMWRLSPSFREQCRRLESFPQVRVRVLSDDMPRAGASAARSALHSRGGRLVTAEIYVNRSSNPTNLAELIAHEIEHVLEQLDGVDLRSESGKGAVWKTDDNAFETRRAIEAGRRVGREVAGIDRGKD